jgi:hypothetical protein
VLEIQATENLQRKNIDPIDEAWATKSFRKNSVTTSKNWLCVSENPKLHSRPAESLTSLYLRFKRISKTDILSLTLGLEIAKYGIDGQREIYKELYEQGDWDAKTQNWLPDKEWLELRKPADIARWAQNNILRVLAKAPFDINSTQLRVDGIACVTVQIEPEPMSDSSALSKSERKMHVLIPAATKLRRPVRSAEASSRSATNKS